MTETKFNIAMLIDGDNFQANFITEIIDEALNYGSINIKRVYGDWSNQQMSDWREIIDEFSITPIQNFSYTNSINFTNNTLIIDAMDILHTKNVSGFCIVSSDKDYSELAKRIREDGFFVMGIGNRNTPVAFINSCEIFAFYEEFIEDETEENNENNENNNVDYEYKRHKSQYFPQVNVSLIDKAFKISMNDDEEALISQIGNSLRSINPGFDSKTYGFKTLSKLFETIDKYEIIDNVVNGLNQPIVRLR